MTTNQPPATPSRAGGRSARTLLAVPNVSEGRDQITIDAIATAFSGDARLLDVHTDPDHHRSVFTLAAGPGRLAEAIASGAREAVARIHLHKHEGVHPRVGALDVAPIVYLSEHDRGAACAEALVLADRLGDELELPVFLYGVLADGRARAEIRRGGPDALAQRIDRHEIRPDFGPPRLHPTAGATLVAARPPLVAFNVDLAPPADLETARSIAARIREGGTEGLPAVRAIGLHLAHQGVAQVSTNIEDPLRTPLAAVVDAVARYATPLRTELVGLAPKAAVAGFPPDVPLANQRLIETLLEDD